jgi:hypothetical protein
MSTKLHNAPDDESEMPTQQIGRAIRHAIRQESDEYACSCGMRWDVIEGEEHP